MANAFWLESTARMLAMAEASLPERRALSRAGTAMAASTPMMEHVTSSSMRLNPDWLREAMAVNVCSSGRIDQGPRLLRSPWFQGAVRYWMGVPDAGGPVWTAAIVAVVSW